jgi:putative nucleotidyltransferase with HDIG domain
LCAVREGREREFEKMNLSLHMASDDATGAAKSPARRKVYVWAERAEQRRLIDSMLSPANWMMLPTAQTGPELVSFVQGGKPAAVIFHYGEGREPVLESLRALETDCPDIPRVVVCGPAWERVFREWKGVPPTLLPEGSSHEVAEEKLARAITLNQWLMQPAIGAVLPRLESIPTLPASHQRVVEALQDPNYSGDTVAQLMAQDIALTTNLFKSVNSAAFGLGRPIHSVQDAITYLGVQRLQALVVSAWAFRFIDDKMCRGFDPQKEWEHAMTVAAGAQELARELGAPAGLRESAFTAGLLHDVGKLLLAANAPDGYAIILEDAREHGRPLWQVEKEDMGFSHAEIGACMLGIWGTGLPIVEAVAWHHEPALAGGGKLSALTLVHVADCRARGIEPDAAQSALVKAP